MRGFSKGIAAVALGMLLTAPALHAQGLEFSLGAGATVPLDAYADQAKTGYNGLAGISYTPSNFPLGFQIDGMYERLKLENDVSDRSSQIIQGTGDLIYKFKTSPESSFRPYLIGGVGVYNFKNVSGNDIVAPDEGNTATDFGLNGGAGFDIKAGGVGLFLEGRFHDVMKDGEDTKFIPITFGIRLGGN
jgi:hypothetical protein